MTLRTRIFLLNSAMMCDCSSSIGAPSGPVSLLGWMSHLARTWKQSPYGMSGMVCATYIINHVSELRIF